MTERPGEEFEDLGPVRFPVPEGHPLLDNEDALEAALLHDALASVVGEGGAVIFTERIVGDSSHSGSRLFGSGWFGARAGTVGSALAGFGDWGVRSQKVFEYRFHNRKERENVMNALKGKYCLTQMGMNNDLESIEIKSIKGEKILARYASCMRCSCQAFEGSGHVCTNCGHNFYDHY